MSNADNPTDRQTKNVRRLLRDGPTPTTDLPKIQPDDRTDGVRTININWARNTLSVPGRIQPVAYHTSHDPEAVVRAFIDANPTLLETTKSSLTRQFGGHSPELKDAWREIADEYDVRTPNADNTGGSKSDNYGRTCPYCGDEITALPFHLPCPEQPE